LSDGEWGRPPIDDYGRPLYGDIFGQAVKIVEDENPVDRSLWATLEEEEEKQEEEQQPEIGGGDEEMEDEEMKTEPVAAAVSEPDTSGIESVSSLASGLETPEAVTLRKRLDGTGTETPDTVHTAPRSLFTVLEEKKASVASSGLFGTDKTYVIPSAASAGSGSGTAAVTGTGAAQLSQASLDRAEAEKRNAERKSKLTEQVDLELNPEELAEGVEGAVLKRKYDEKMAQMREARELSREDVSEVAMEHRKKKQKTSDKKKSSFKF